jgi:hypothetical protein
VRKTWAPVGDTPIFKHSYSRERISAISAVTVSPSRKRLGLYFRFHSTNITGVEVICVFHEIATDPAVTGMHTGEQAASRSRSEATLGFCS